MTRHPKVAQIAGRVPLALTTCPVTRELYAYARPALDEHVTLHRVGVDLFADVGRYRLTPGERETALRVITERFEALPR